jgi:hypothetical protein
VSIQPTWRRALFILVWICSGRVEPLQGMGGEEMSTRAHHKTNPHLISHAAHINPSTTPPFLLYTYPFLHPSVRKKEGITVGLSSEHGIHNQWPAAVKQRNYQPVSSQRYFISFLGQVTEWSSPKLDCSPFWL